MHPGASLSMFFPASRMGPNAQAPKSLAEQHAVQLERRVLLAQAMESDEQLKSARLEYEHFMVSKEAQERLNHRLPACLPLGTAVRCSTEAEQAILIDLDICQPLRTAGLACPTTIGLALYTLTNYEGALAEIERHSADSVLDKDQESLWALCLIRLGHWQEALDWFQHAVEVDPRSALAYAGKGLALNALGRPLEALVQFRHGLHLDSNHAELHFLSGETMSCLERYGAANLAYLQALRLAPGNALYQEHQRWALSAAGGLDSSLPVAELTKRQTQEQPPRDGLLKRSRMARRKQQAHRSSNKSRRSLWGFGALLVVASTLSRPPITAGRSLRSQSPSYLFPLVEEPAPVHCPPLAPTLDGLELHGCGAPANDMYLLKQNRTQASDSRLTYRDV